ncbi:MULTISPECIES: ankyrin repeat domain-containing protein [unclassified Rhizobium]|uniref:ankyrin repeat domain-containing protein n=1 Tax=unclassified Rhizobium TaxID=2613769 RepID=UPI000EA87886|nr:MULTISPECIES: ankyrin repeat domain-containing protein [unclassified Rhizobium]AYG68062.1 ankyrin repeat domain-containing protein [Rhizobium sp. CCGE531]AYG74448.1 ankyrin repeat domain-containing protein [Rhizobium sp. CCGE532]
MTFKALVFRGAVLSGIVAAVTMSLGMLVVTASDVSAASAQCKKLDPNGKDMGGDTNFALAVRDKKADVVKQMLACGAKLDMKTTEGWYPLHTAAYYGPADMIDFLVSKGADVNARGDYDGWTPLHMASQQDDPAVVKALLKDGADKTIKSASGKTAAEMATDPAIAALLK